MNEPKIELTAEERKTLLAWSRGRSTPARLVLRAKIVLAAAAGKLNQEIAAELRTLRKTVSLWRSRFASQRIADIEKDAPRPGRSPSIPAETVELILRKTTQEKPSAATHWSTRMMAKAVGVSKATVQRAWAAHGPKPQLVKTFKVSNDPQFAEQLRDVVGCVRHYTSGNRPALQPGHLLPRNSQPTGSHCFRVFALSRFHDSFHRVRTAKPH